MQRVGKGQVQYMNKNNNTILNMHDKVESILGKGIFKLAPVLLTLLCVLSVFQIFFDNTFVNGFTLLIISFNFIYTILVLIKIGKYYNRKKS